MLNAALTVTTNYQKLSDLLVAAGITDATSNSITTDPGYILNRSGSINVYIATGTSTPTGTQPTITPLASVLFRSGMNTNAVWLASASSTATVEFVEGANAYSNPALSGVIGTITLSDNVIPKGSSNNLVASSITDNGTTVAVTEPITSTGSIKSSSATDGIGYATGAGGAVTQATDKSTAVTSNTVTTAITMNAASLAASTTVSFTFTNSSIAATDQVVVTHESAGTSAAYNCNAFPSSGSAVVSVRNVTLGALAEAIVLRVSVYKAVSA